MGEEQDFAMSADTQNAKNAAARAEGLLLPGRGLSYSPYVMGGALSSILAPSLPDYVRPDYRLNESVGLPGAQGFDDPDYGVDGLPMFAFGTGQSDQWAPGYVPTAGLPGQLPKQDYPTWVSSAVDRILFNLRDGNAANDGKPGDWNDAQYGDWNRLVQLAQYPAGVPQSAEVALYDYVQNSQATNDLSYALGLGARPSPSATDYTENLTPSEKLAREQFEYTKQQNALKMAMGGGSGGSSSSRVSSASTRSYSGGGGGGSSTADDLAYLQAKTDAASSLAQQEFDLKKQLMLLQFELDNDPNNPKLLLQQQQLAEEKRQFDATLARMNKADQDAVQLQRAKLISDYSANPGDAVAREYFLRTGANPVGNAVNIFTGQPTGQQMTLSEVMQANAPVTGAALGSTMTGTPPPTTTAEPTTPPPPPVDTAPIPEETPQYARGTRRGDPQITRDGWTRAPEFISGDPQMMGEPNPEHIKLRVRNGEAEAKITPLSQMLGRRNRRMPMFADGTDPWAWQGINWDQSGSDSSMEPVSYDFNPDNLAQPQAASYQPSTAPATSFDVTQPYVVQPTSGNPVNTTAVASDPYFGTAYQGMAPDQVVTNANSQFYGMTAQDAFTADQRHAEIMNSYDPRALDDLGQVTKYAPLTVVGPTAGATTGGWTSSASGPDVAPPESWLDPTYYSWTGTEKIGQGAVQGSTGYERPIINVNTQADAGILTGAQATAGATQSANPGAPGYVSPLAPPPGNLENDDIQRPAPEETAAPAVGAAPGKTADLTDGKSYTLGQDGKWYPQDQVPLPQGAATGSPTKTTSPITAPTTQTQDGATWQLQPGDIPNPYGPGYLRYDPAIKDYRPVEPKLTVIESEEQFWSLPPDVQQKILTGQPTGYALAQQPNSQWRDGLLAGLGQPGMTGGPLRPDAFMALSDDEKRDLLINMPWQMGSSLPAQQGYVPNTGPLAGSWDGLLRLNNPQGALSAGQIDYGPLLIGPNESADGFGYGPNAPTEYNRIMYPEQQVQPPNPSSGNAVVPETPPPPPATGTDTAAGGGTTPPPPPATGTGTPPPPATGEGAGGAPGGGTPPPATGQDALMQALAQLLGLSYGNQTYQDLPALQYALGNLSGGEYDTISNSPIEVPGLGLSLPGANSMMNYEMLQKLIQNGSFDLLNSLYTAGNVPLSLILAMSKARAPLGSAYDTGLIETT
jgi:hypothetical protein